MFLVEVLAQSRGELGGEVLRRDISSSVHKDDATDRTFSPPIVVSIMSSSSTTTAISESRSPSIDLSLMFATGEVSIESLAHQRSVSLTRALPVQRRAYQHGRSAKEADAIDAR